VECCDLPGALSFLLQRLGLVICKPGDLHIVYTVCKFFLLVLCAAAGIARVKITAIDVTEGAASSEEVEHLSEGE
jgi:hypothetical protein